MADEREPRREPEENLRFWFRLSCGLLALTLVGVALTVRGLLLAFADLPAADDVVDAEALAGRIGEALRWMAVGMAFFWPGVIVAIVAFWKKYVTARPGRRDEETSADSPEA